MFTPTTEKGENHMTNAKMVARIHEAPTGRWHVTNDALDYLDERGDGQATRRDAIQSARLLEDYTHYLRPNGKIVRL